MATGLGISMILHLLLILFGPGLRPLDWEASPPQSIEITLQASPQAARDLPQQSETEPTDQESPANPKKPEQPSGPPEDTEGSISQTPSSDQQSDPTSDPQQREPVDQGELAEGEVDPQEPEAGDAADQNLLERRGPRFAGPRQETRPSVNPETMEELEQTLQQATDRSVDWEETLETQEPVILRADEPGEQPDTPANRPVVFDLPEPGEQPSAESNEATTSPEPEDWRTQRKAVNQPLPTMPDWLEEEGTSVRVVVEFTVNRDGVVTRAGLRTSSGYPELDDLVLEHVRKWKYQPGPSSDQRLAAFRFELRPGGGVEPDPES